MSIHILRGALLASVVILGACQTSQQGPAPSPVASSPMDGVWASTDGVFVANFERGNFTSRFTTTNEILAQGQYTVAGSNITMNWISVATQQQRSAACSFQAADTVGCTQQGGGSFTLKRSAGAPATG